MFPKNIQIETTTICAANCIMCPHRYVSRPKFMDLALIEKIIDECKDKDVTIIPHQMGDPLADPRIIEILKRCKNRNLKILMSTSALLLDKDKIKDIVEAGVDVINISLDSLDKRLYEKIRKISFDRVMKNVKDLIAMERPGVSVWVSAVDIFFDKKTKKEFIEYWKGLVDNVQIAPYVRYPKVNYWRLPRKKWRDSNCCQRLEADMVILSNGEVAKCCIDFEGVTSFGNIKDETISQIWNGPKRRGFSEKMRASGRKRLYPCNICII